MSIQPLPPEVIAQIKSSIAITSLNGVICQLVKNSLDASSTKIDITVDYPRGGCVVEDDGLGIQPPEFGEGGGLGKLYHSSKLNTQQLVHGSHGTFLASLSAMALLTITSHHHLHRSHNTISMHRSEVVSRQTPASAQQYLTHSNHGTKATVRDLFGNMPVRVKQRALVADRRGNQKEWEELRRDVVMLLLSWPGRVSLNVRELDGNQKLSIRPLGSSEIAESDVSRTCSILAQAALITPDKKTSWVPVGISTSSLNIHGFISLQPSAVKHLQFISFGIHPLKLGGQSILHDQINKMFSNSSFGNEVEMTDLEDAERARRAKDQRYKGEGYTQKELKGKKGVERWPMFYINIGVSNSSELARQLDPDKYLDDTWSKFGTISDLLQAMITKFLTLHHFRPKSGRGKQSKGREGQSTPNKKPVSPKQIATSSLSLATINKVPTKNVPLSFDPLGANIKLPSFRRSSAESATPLDGWSKIKSGISRINTAGKDRPTRSIQRPSSTPPQSSSEKHFTAPRPSTPLIAGDGKILRRPFDDAIVAPRLKTTLKPPSSHENPPKVGDEDEFVECVHPVTRVRCILKKRTGMATAHENEWNSSRISQKLPSSNSGPKFLAERTNASSSWMKDILQTWQNPVFTTAEPAIPQIALEGSDEHTQSILHGRHHHCSQVDINRAFKESSAGVNGRISKATLKDAQVTAQIDRKFILVTVQANSGYCEDMILLLVDQHAADERIRIEALLETFCTPPTDAALLGKSSVTTTLLKKPLIFEVSIREMTILEEQRLLFAHWGIIYEVNSSRRDSSDITAMCRLSVLALPPGIMERCKQEPRLLVELIRTEAWRVHESGKAIPSLALSGSQTWLQRIQNCPQGIFDMLNSRACRGAIMFNDELSKGQCEKLVRQLADCKFPFQCAHGRPSLVPLVDVSTLKDINDEGMLDGGRNSTFGHAFRRWKQTLG